MGHDQFDGTDLIPCAAETDRRCYADASQLDPLPLAAEDMREIFSAIILPGASPPFNARYAAIFDRTHRIMQFYRLYAGADGQSHFEPLDCSKNSEFFNKTRDAKGLLFRNDFAPHILDYHPAPHRRWVITLSGSVEIGLGDGTRITFYPGDVFLAEDTTGQGHSATPHDWVRAYVDLEPAKTKHR